MIPPHARRRALRPCLEHLDRRWVPAATVAGLTAAQIAQAYGFNSVGATGAGQTIAIVDAYHDPYLASDLATFDKANNLPGQTTSQLAGTLTQVNLAGTLTIDGWAGEEALDAEWVHAVAPGAKIVVVEAASNSLTDLMTAVNVARNIPGVSVVSMSWGGPEFAGETSYDSYFTTPAGHTPITFVAASGDSGAYAGAEWPASSPNVVAVGGTKLSTTSSGTIVSESGWSGSGGGVSLYESQPAYQTGVQSTGRRTTPDVSLVADPYTGLATYVTAPSTGLGTWEQVGGTSASTQIWAGLLANADQVRAIFGKGTLDTATTLTTLYKTPAAFNDITSGSNGYSAGPGYDLVTGLGSPRAFPTYVNLYQPGPLLTAAAASTPATATHATKVSPAAVVQATTATTLTTPGAASSVGSATITATSTTTVTADQAVALSPSPSGSNAQPVPSNAAPQGLAGSPAAVLSIPVNQSLSLAFEAPGIPPAYDTPSALGTATPADDVPPSPAEPLPGREGGVRVGRIADPAAQQDAINVRLEGAWIGPRFVAADPTDEGVLPTPSSARVVASERGQTEEPTRVSMVGVAVVALAVPVWQTRTRPRSATPQGPRELFPPHLRTLRG